MIFFAVVCFDLFDKVTQPASSVLMCTVDLFEFIAAGEFATIMSRFLPHSFNSAFFFQILVF